MIILNVKCWIIIEQSTLTCMVRMRSSWHHCNLGSTRNKISISHALKDLSNRLQLVYCLQNFHISPISSHCRVYSSRRGEKHTQNRSTHGNYKVAHITKMVKEGICYHRETYYKANKYCGLGLINIQHT